MSRLRDEGGFSMIELVVAMFLIAIVMGALALLFVNSNDSSYANQRELTEMSVLQQQVEQVRETVAQYGFGALALTGAPSSATDSTLPGDPTNPDDFVSGSGCGESFTVQSNYNATTESFPTGQSVADNPEPLLINGCTVSGTAISGGELAPVQYVDMSTGSVYSSLSSIPVTDLSATLYTFVTQTTTVGCNGSGCTGDGRRVILALVPNAAAADIGAYYPANSSSASTTSTTAQCGTVAPSARAVLACSTAYSTTLFSNPVASNYSNSASLLKIFGKAS